MEQVNSSMLVRKEAATIIGLKWEGTFAEAGAGGIREVQTEFKRRLQEISDVLHPQELLGLSYHTTDTGFVHYVAVEVGEAGASTIPSGMVKVDVPAHDYAKCSHVKGQSVEASYNRIYTWIAEQGHVASQGPLTHYEVYPMDQDPYDPEPEFTIFIPVNQK
ncbi:GyrI-like domain-containing protein [Paenibacillus illinoisensis]|uniref:GyrI-like domain-containing protein n=2 Tax=Paenibacillus illinoisensis TaxID=59845 RepID=UPI00301D5E5F